MRTRGKVAPVGGDLRAQELTHVRDLVGNRLQRGRPAGLDELAQRPGTHIAKLTCRRFRRALSYLR